MPINAVSNIPMASPLIDAASIEIVAAVAIAEPTKKMPSMRRIKVRSGFRSRPSL